MALFPRFLASPTCGLLSPSIPRVPTPEPVRSRVLPRNRAVTGAGYEGLVDEPVVIRPATADDAGAVARIYAPYVASTAVSFEEEAPVPEEVVKRIKASHVWLIADSATEVIGYAYAAPFHPRPAYRWSVEISVYLTEAATGRGIGRLLLSSLLDALRAAGFVNAFAGTTLPNEASVGLFESFGFERIALQHKVGYKLGAWHDVGWWQLRLQDPIDPPPLPG